MLCIIQRPSSQTPTRCFRSLMAWRHVMMWPKKATKLTLMWKKAALPEMMISLRILTRPSVNKKEQLPCFLFHSFFCKSCPRKPHFCIEIISCQKNTFTYIKISAISQVEWTFGRILLKNAHTKDKNAKQRCKRDFRK